MQFATEFGSFVFLVTGNLVYKCQFACRDGSRVPAQHKSVIQPFSRISPGEDLRPGLVLQDRTIVCWLNVLVTW